jgi:thiosulfate dehydrogenase
MDCTQEQVLSSHPNASLPFRTMVLSAATLVAGLLPISSATAADADAGARIAAEGTEMVPSCASCHGEDGLGDADMAAPMIAGLEAGYILHALKGYADGTRNGPTMSAIAPDLTADEMADVAAHYAAAPVSAKDWEIDTENLTRGERVARQGDWAEGAPSCVSCHGPNLEGVGGSFPRLAGQLPDYLAARLDAWQSGDETVDTPDEALMASVAAKLSTDDIIAVTAYMGSLAPDATDVTGYDAVDLDWPKGTYNVKDLPAEIPWDKAQKAYETQQARQNNPNAVDHTPPSFDDIPDGPEGEMIRLGRFLFSNTQTLRGEFVGNTLNCVNCHMAEGASSTAPLWPTAVDFPQYRGKNQHVNTLPERIAGCFSYSMDGTPPPAQHKVMVALEAYMKWLGTGIPSDAVLKHRGYTYLPLPEKTPDFARGETVYAERCAVCHGQDGQGTTVAGRVVFPPLWGDNSYNWGAGMHTMEKAAGFLKANMPLGNADLTDQEAWDVAQFMNSHERPQDPRWKGDVQATRNAHHNHACTYGLETPAGLMGDTGTPKAKPAPKPWKQWSTEWAPRPSE